MIDIINKKHQHIMVILILMMLLSTFVIIAWPYLLDNFNSSITDQRSYLKLGIDIKNLARLTDGARHPLFSMLLSLFAGYEWEYFTSAKLLNLGFSLVLFVLIFYLTYKLLGVEAGVITVILTVFNKNIPEIFTKVITEPLLTIFCLIALYFVAMGIQQQKDKFFVLAGFFTGFSYLTKGTGQLLFLQILGILLLTIFLSKEKRFRPLVLFFLAYFLTALPLLTYNYFTWGDPFYNYTSSEVMWYSDFDDVYTNSDQTGIAGFLQNTRLDDFVERMRYGIQITGFKFWDIFLFSPVTLIVLSISLLNFLLLQAFRTKPQSPFKLKKSLFLIPLIILPGWFVFFSWFAAISNGDRHFIPVLPVVNILIAAFFVYTIKNIGYPAIVQKHFVSVAAGLVLLICAIFVTQTVLHLKSYPTLNPYLSDVANNAQLDELIAGLEKMDPTMTVITGPSRFMPEWHTRKFTLKFVEVPETVKSADELLAFMEKKPAKVLIVDGGTILHRGFLQDFFELKNQDTFSKFKYKNPLPKLELMADYKCGQSQIMIFTYPL